jgi:hypothetical protein
VENRGIEKIAIMKNDGFVIDTKSDGWHAQTDFVTEGILPSGAFVTEAEARAWVARLAPGAVDITRPTACNPLGGRHQADS